MEKTKFCKESIKELATVLGLKVDNVTTIELLNKIKKIFLLEENLDNKVVQTYEEEPAKRLFSVIQSIGMDSDSYTKLYENYLNRSVSKRKEVEKIIEEHNKEQKNLEDEFFQQIISLFFTDK